MKLALHALALLLFTAQAATAQVVISQVNGNGGLTGDTYDRDFVELFNKGTTTVDLDGWSLLLFADLGTAGSPFTPTWTTLPLTGTIDPGQYLLIIPTTLRGSLSATVTSPPLPPADLLATPETERNLGSSANAVALMNAVITLNDGDCPVGHPNLVDFIRYGLSNAICFEGSGPIIGPTAAQRAVLRADDGCTDTNENINDLFVGQFPDPRNGYENRFVSSVFLEPSVINGDITPSAIRVSRGFSPCNPLPPGNLAGATADLSAFGLSSNQMLFDDGLHGDLGASDGVYGFSFDIAANQAPGRYDVAVTATGNGGGMTLASTAILWVFPAVATNDLCTSPIALSGTGPVLFSGYVNTANASADEDSGSCNGDTVTKHSVWFSYTHATGGAIRIEETSSEDIVASVFTGCGGASAACQRNELGDFYIPMAAGVPMLIQIGQETGSSQVPRVPLNLTIYYEPGVDNDTVCGALPLELGSATLTPNAAATAAVEENGLGISCDQGTNPPEARRGVWYTYTAPASGATIMFSESTSNFTDMSAFTSSDGTCNGTLTEAGCVKESALRPYLHLLPNTTYFILFSLDTFSVIPQVPYHIEVTIFPNADNDTACTAEEIVFQSNYTVNSIATTPDSGHSGSTCTTAVSRFHGVWYTFTSGPGQTGAIRMIESGESDIFWNVYTGPNCAVLTPAACPFSEDAGVAVVPDTTYWILLSLSDTSSSTARTNGDYEITFEFYPTPSNDTPCGAIDVLPPGLTDDFYGPAATVDIDTTCNFNIPVQTTTNNGGWYRIQLSEPKLLTVTDSGSDDMVFALFTDSDCNDLTTGDEIDCKMGGAIPSDVAHFELEAGPVYWLLAGKISTSFPFGMYNLTIDLLDPPGACCHGDACEILTEPECTGYFAGAFTNCGDVPQYEDPVAEPIPEVSGGLPGLLTKTINVPDSGTIDDIKVLIDINHAKVGDLIITLQAPDFTTQDLIRRIDDTDGGCPNFGSQGRLTDLGGVYIFDDQSVNPYGPSMPPAAKYFDFTGLVVLPGHYKPTTCNDVVVSLNDAFAGHSITGDWVLTITDNQNGSTGTLNRWGLIINYGDSPTCTCHGDLDAGGTVNGADIQPFVDCVISGLGANCPCADFSGNGTPGVEDVAEFVDRLLGT